MTISNQGTGRLPLRGTERTLLVIDVIVGGSAAICGLLLPWNSLGMSKELLDGSPFHSFMIPGIVLSGVVGGSLLWSAVAIWRRSDHARGISLASGVVLLGWILVESWIIGDGRVLQIAILASALAVIALAFRITTLNTDGIDERDSTVLLRS